MERNRRIAQSLIEYGLILALVAIIALAILTKFGGTMSGVGNNTSNTVNAASSQAGKSYCDSVGGSWSSATNLCTP